MALLGGALTMTSVHSFDVFDTCLVRTVAVPGDLFFLVAEAVLQRRRDTVTKEEIVELARLRVEANRSAWTEANREDVPLEQIYRHMDLPWGITAAEMMEEELRLESQLARPIARMRAELQRLRSEGEKIVFMSDTPIPVDHLREMLQRAGLANEHEPVYTSGDLGLTKKTGRLFDYVLGEEGEPDGWVHHGDHPQGDIEVALGKGIEVAPFLDARLTQYERMLLAEGEEKPWVRSRIAGVSRVARLSADVGEDDVGLPALPDLAAGVVGPLLTSFVAWVIREARKVGVERLYFVSRDGDILLHIVRELKKRMPTPECRYLHGSRQAWLFPAITRLDREALHWVLDESPTFSDMLAKLSLEPSELGDLLDAYGFGEEDLAKRLDEDELERFWGLLSEPDVVSLVLSRAEEARQTTLAYLQQEGLTSAGRWALVDVGWKLRSQWALKRMLHTVGHGEKVAGYYLGLSRDRRAMVETGPYRALFMPEENEDMRILLGRAMVLEQAFLSADHGAVIGYGWEEGRRAVPILQEWVRDERRSRYLADIRQVVTIHTREALAAGLLDEHLDQLCKGALRVTVEFLTRPTRDEAETVAWMTAVDDLRHDTAKERRLAVPLGPGDALGRAAMGNLGRLQSVQRYRSRPRRYFWEEGSLALSRPWVQAVFRLASSLRLRKAVEAPVNTARRMRRELTRPRSARK